MEPPRLHSKIGLRVFYLPFSVFSSDIFPDTRDKISQVRNPKFPSLSRYFFRLCHFLCASLSISIRRKRQGLTRYLDRGLPSHCVFRIEFRTHFFSHWDAASPVPFLGLLLSICVVETPRREKDRRTQRSRKSRVFTASENEKEKRMRHCGSAADTMENSIIGFSKWYLPKITNLKG